MLKLIPLLAVVERDLRRFTRNPLVVLSSILMPILYLVILGNSFQGELKNIPLAYVDMDNGPYARRVTELLQAIGAGPRTIQVTKEADQGKALKGIKDGRYKGVLILPSDFSRNIINGNESEIGLFLDNTETIAAETLRSAITAAASSINVKFIPVREKRDQVVIRNIEIYRKVDYDQSLIPGVVIMSIFLGTITTGVFNTVMDKFLGIEESYLLTPLTKRDIVIGLVTSGLIITTAIATLVLFFSALISGIYIWKTLTVFSFLSILLVIILTTLGLLGMMFVILGRANHPRIVGVFAGFLNVIFFFPSGAIYPVESFPEWLKAFARVNPETYSVHAIKALLFKGVSIRGIEMDFIYLAAFAFTTMTIATLIYKREL
ncbi:MAG: ABC transporter permease [Nitrospirae bacterium]|nr:ABC transporter permease [Nitrospirota bacterium]